LIPELWDEKNQQFRKNIIGSQEFTRDNAQDIADVFDNLRKFILRESYKLPGVATTEWLQTTIDKFTHRETPRNETLNQYIKRFLKEAKSGERLCFSGNSKRQYSAGSIRNMKDFKTSFNLYQTNRRKRLNFEDITIDFYNDYLAYFFKRKCGTNYVGKHLKTLKTIMRQAREEGLHNNMEVERKAFRVIREDVDSVYLTADEVTSLFEMTFPDSEKHYEVARDVFLCGIYTAQRYSDYSRITKDNIRGGNIELIQSKTGEKCIIPIRPELDLILKKYDYTLPRTHDQKINLYIKEIARRAGITETINTEKTKGGFKVKEKFEKCQLIRTHTARRTGCTLMYLAGIASLDIMKISGHRTEREFLKYIKVTKEQTAANLSLHPYFAGNLLKVVK